MEDINNHRLALPSNGDVVEIVTENSVVSATVEVMLISGVLVAKKSNDDRIFAKLSESRRWEELYIPEDSWDNPAFAEARRKELRPKVGERRTIDLLTFVFRGDFNDGQGDGEWGSLPLATTVIEVMEDGGAHLRVESFELRSSPDFWINREKFWGSGDELGLYLPNGTCVN